MTTAEKVEAASAPIFGTLAFVLADALPNTLSFGTLLLIASVILLLQSLVRDLWLLSSAKRRENADPEDGVPCMCIESIVGVAGVVAGIGLLAAGVQWHVSMRPWGWALLVFAVIAFGFFVKDYVIGWSPWRIRKDKDHLNIVFSWKRR